MMPVLRNVLTYSDRKLVEQACLAITGVVDSYRHHPDKLEALLTGELLTAVAALMVPGATNAQVDASTHPKILKLLSTAAKSSPEIAMNLIEMNIANTIYQLLTGVSQPSEEEGIAGIKKHLDEDDMLVLNNLVHRSKDVVQETLNLVHELMPALPKGLLSLLQWKFPAEAVLVQTEFLILGRTCTAAAAQRPRKRLPVPAVTLFKWATQLPLHPR